MPLAFLATSAHAGSCAAIADQHPQILYCWTTFQSHSPTCSTAWNCAELRNSVVGLAEPHSLGLSPSIQPAQIPLQSPPTIQQTNTSTQLSVNCRTLRLSSIAFTRFSVKLLNKAGPSTEPWDITQVRTHQLDAAQFPTSLWAWSFSQILTQWTVHLSEPWADTFSTTMPWQGVTFMLYPSPSCSNDFLNCYKPSEPPFFHPVWYLPSRLLSVSLRESGLDFQLHHVCTALHLAWPCMLERYSQLKTFRLSHGPAHNSQDKTAQKRIFTEE